MLHDLFNKWKYSNAPEGQNPFEKVFGLSKYGMAAGVIIGSYDCTVMSQTYTFWKALNCMSYWVIPFTAMCATYASVAYTVTKLRGEDGYANYIAATFATSGVFHQWQKNGNITYAFTVYLLLASIIKKHGDLHNWNPLPMYPEIRSQHSVFPFDWTLTKDPRGRRPWE